MFFFFTLLLLLLLLLPESQTLSLSRPILSRPVLSIFRHVTTTTLHTLAMPIESNPIQSNPIQSNKPAICNVMIRRVTRNARKEKPFPPTAVGVHVQSFVASAIE
ncbi:uncharacterized protein IWZ02DRAFT_289524 [Phyllosticta citriasiana]|uniref:uncharacterized protein n=1 Tax=Phyllosticta citriasiana TaxID=595635 RepID=UPI0030FD7E2B